MNNDQIIHEELKQAFKVSKKFLLGNKTLAGENNRCYYTIEKESAFGELIGVYTEKTNGRTRNFRVSLN